MNDTVVVNANSDVYDVYIGRPSKWGNPYSIGDDGTRSEVLIKYETYLRTNETLLNEIRSLRGLKLGCPGGCKPHKKCHGDVIIKLLLESERDDMLEY